MCSAIVSVVMPCFNGGDYINSAITSVLSQTYTDFELIIVDDGSTDASLDVIKSFEDKRIVLLSTRFRQGAAHARNLAIENAKGNFIAFLDCDDEWLPNKLEIQLSYMQKNDLAFSWAAYNVINSSGKFLREQQSQSKCTYHSLLNKKTVIGCLTAIYDIEKLGKIFMPSIRMRQDLGLWLSIVKKCQLHGYKYAGIVNVVANYRIHKLGMSSNKLKAAIYQWRLYRNVECLSFSFSIYYFSCYIVNAFKDRLQNRTE